MFISLATLADHPQEELVDSIWLQIREEQQSYKRGISQIWSATDQRGICFPKRILLHFGEILNLLCLNMATPREKKKKKHSLKTGGQLWCFFLFFSFLFSEKTPLYELHRISFYAKQQKFTQKKKKTSIYPLFLFSFVLVANRYVEHSGEFIFQHFMSFIYQKHLGNLWIIFVFQCKFIQLILLMF